MVTKQETALAQKGVIEKRVEMSEALLKRMGMTGEEYQRICLNALLLNPALAQCTNHSIDVAVIQCINAGLVPDGKQAAIIPFKDTATLVPMIEGKLMLARRATPGIVLVTKVVYAGDDFEYAEGFPPVLKHNPSPTADRRAENIIAAYAWALVPGAQYPEMEVFFRGDIDRYRGYARSQRGPWETHFAEMAKKAVLGQVVKRMPKAVGAPPEPPPELDLVEWQDTPTGVALVDGVAADPQADAPEPEPVRRQPRQPKPAPPVVADLDTGEIEDEPTIQDDDDEAPF